MVSSLSSTLCPFPTRPVPEHCALWDGVCPCSAVGPHPGESPLLLPCEEALPGLGGLVRHLPRMEPVPPAVGASTDRPLGHSYLMLSCWTRACGHSPGHLSCHTCPRWKVMMADHWITRSWAPPTTIFSQPCEASRPKVSGIWANCWAFRSSLLSPLTDKRRRELGGLSIIELF